MFRSTPSGRGKATASSRPSVWVVTVATIMVALVASFFSPATAAEPTYDLTVDIQPSTSTVSVNANGFNPAVTNHLKVVIDDATVYDQDFADSVSTQTFALTQWEQHTYMVCVTAGDDTVDSVHSRCVPSADYPGFLDTSVTVIPLPPLTVHEQCDQYPLWEGIESTDQYTIDVGPSDYVTAYAADGYVFPGGEKVHVFGSPPVAIKPCPHFAVSGFIRVMSCRHAVKFFMINYLSNVPVGFTPKVIRNGHVRARHFVVPAGEGRKFTMHHVRPRARAVLLAIGDRSTVDRVKIRRHHC